LKIKSYTKNKIGGSFILKKKFKLSLGITAALGSSLLFSNDALAQSKIDIGKTHAVYSEEGGCKMGPDPQYSNTKPLKKSHLYKSRKRNQNKKPYRHCLCKTLTCKPLGMEGTSKLTY
jgi:hypothetical protein